MSSQPAARDVRLGPYGAVAFTVALGLVFLAQALSKPLLFTLPGTVQGLKQMDVPTLILQGDDDQIVLLSVKLLKQGTLKVYAKYPHGMCTTHADVINADLLVFLGGGGMKTNAVRRLEEMGVDLPTQASLASSDPTECQLLRASVRPPPRACQCRQSASVTSASASNVGVSDRRRLRGSPSLLRAITPLRALRFCQTDPAHRPNYPASAKGRRQQGHSPSCPWIRAENAVGCGMVMIALNASGARWA